MCTLSSVLFHQCITNIQRQQFLRSISSQYINHSLSSLPNYFICHLALEWIQQIRAQRGRETSCKYEEIYFLQDENSISDLEYHLIDGNHRSRADKAIKNYFKYIKKEANNYNRIFNNKFKHFSKEYIDSLIDANFRKPLINGDLDSNLLNFFR